MKNYCLKSSMIFLADDKMLIDTEKKAIRKYNESACLILAQLEDGPISTHEICSRIRDENGEELLSSGAIDEFVLSLFQSGLLVSLDRFN